MKAKKRQKLCYNCEGEVDLDVIVCPFCAADLREEKPEQSSPPYHHHLKNLDTQKALYPSSHTPPEREEVAAPELAITEEEDETETRSSYAPIILLTFGAQLLLLGLFMLLFSNQGTLTLQWDTRFWYFYLLASLPLLIFGYKALNIK